MLFTPPNSSSSSSSSSSSTKSSPCTASSSVCSLIQSIFSYDGNVMLAAIISLLLVILFVLLLHVYAKWFLAQARHRSRSSSVSVSHVLGPSRFHHFNTITMDTSLSNTPTKGLEAHVIASIPLFVYESKNHHDPEEVLECAICLSFFEEQDMGRKLSKCGHAFHVECIDMWLHAHTDCPICRAPANENKAFNQMTISDVVVVEDLQSIRSGSSISELSAEIDIVVEIPDSDLDENVLWGRDSLSACSSSSSISGSLKRMLSRNSSEHKVHPSSASDESDN